MKDKQQQGKDGFVQGYVACVVAIINGHGIGTEVIEAYRCGVGSMSFQELKKSGVDEYDLFTIKKHWNELSSKKINHEQ